MFRYGICGPFCKCIDNLWPRVIHINKTNDDGKIRISTIVNDAHLTHSIVSHNCHGFNFFFSILILYLLLFWLLQITGGRQTTKIKAFDSLLHVGLRWIDFGIESMQLNEPSGVNFNNSSAKIGFVTYRNLTSQKQFDVTIKHSKPRLGSKFCHFSLQAAYCVI